MGRHRILDLALKPVQRGHPLSTAGVGIADRFEDLQVGLGGGRLLLTQGFLRVPNRLGSRALWGRRYRFRRRTRRRPGQERTGMGSDQFGHHRAEFGGLAQRIGHDRDVLTGQPGRPPIRITGGSADPRYRVEQVLVGRHRVPLIPVTLGSDPGADNSPLCGALSRLTRSGTSRRDVAAQCCSTLRPHEHPAPAR